MEGKAVATAVASWIKQHNIAISSPIRSTRLEIESLSKKQDSSGFGASTFLQLGYLEQRKRSAFLPVTSSLTFPESPLT